MTLVSILGDFSSSVLPIFYEFTKSIEKHIIVYDDYKKDVAYAQKIIKGTQNYINKYQLDIQTYAIKLDEDSHDQLIQLTHDISSIESDYKQIYINATDGLASISLILSNVFLQKGSSFIVYDRFDNEYNILQNDSYTKHKINHVLSIDDHFLLKNTTITKQSNLQIADSLEEELNFFFETCNGEKEEYQIRSDSLDSDILTIQTGFLFELYIYNLLKRLYYDDIAVGVKIRDLHQDNYYLDNEFDILIMKDNHLHMIECKYQTDIKAVDLVYKVDSVRNIIDSDANLMIVSNSDYYNSEIQEQKVNSIFHRATINRVYFNSSPQLSKAEFIIGVDKRFNLKTPDLKKLIEQSYNKKVLSVSEKIQEMNETLQKHFDIELDFFHKKNILLILAYKSYFRNNEHINTIMKDPNLHQLVKSINQLLNSNKDISINHIYSDYINIFLD